MVIVRIQGGLGNQLFQYAFGLYIAKKYDLVVKFDAQLNIDINGVTKRDLSINKCGFELPLASANEIKSITSMYSNSFWYRFKRKITQKIPFTDSFYRVQCFNPHIINFDLSKDNVYYDGYWQDSRIVEDVLAILLDKIHLKKDNVDNQIHQDRIVSIHVRRGDYINVGKNIGIFSICKIEYFQKAISYLNNKIEDLHYYVFSDDIEWAKQNFTGDFFTFIEGNSAVDDLLMMSNCKYNIISNSTFSTWAAYFNTYPDKIVVYPQNWYNNYFNDYLDKITSRGWVGL